MSSSVVVTQTQHPLFPTLDEKATVNVHALSAGHLTLPESAFVHPASDTARNTVPSLAFLIQHVDRKTGKRTRILFDLGLRRDPSRYAEPIRKHAVTRQPLSTDPDVVKSLAAGGLKPDDIDYIIYSHVHWDHIGEPRDFPNSTFIIGHGASALLSGSSSSSSSPSLRGTHSYFEPDLLDPARTISLPDPSSAAAAAAAAAVAPEPGSKTDARVSQPGAPRFAGPWVPLPSHGLPATLDLFGDGVLRVVDAPGHLPGHVNLLARTGASSSSSSKAAAGRGDEWVYLAGDACHDRRILRGERAIGEWRDGEGRVCCIHADRKRAEETIERIRGLEARGVEVVFAHDVEWERGKGREGGVGFFGRGG